MEFLSEFLDIYRLPYFLCQVAVILYLYVLGYATVCVLSGSKRPNADHIRMRLVLAFPVGVSVFIMIGYGVLVSGIKYSAPVVGGITTAILIILTVVAILKKRLKRDIKKTYVLITCVIIILAALVATSGYIRISVSNDSLYYFWQYPRAICYFGKLRDQFDNFLTDTGLGAAVIGTLPFLFGFGETFGIQEFFHMSFIAFFTNAVYETVKLKKLTNDDKKACVISCGLGVLFASCTPVYIISHWAMANMYFMELFFIGMYLLYRESLRNIETSVIGGQTGVSDVSTVSAVCGSLEEKYILMFILFACGTMRMEGSIFVLLMAGIASMLNISKSELIIPLLPLAIIQRLFEIKVFTTYVIDNPYTFLTPLKACIQAAAFVGMIVYIGIIRDKIPHAIKKHIPILSVFALVMANIVLLAMDSTTYIGNLKALVGNLLGQSGWGILPYISVGAILVIVVLVIESGTYKSGMGSIIDPKRGCSSYWTLAVILFLLTTLLVSFARGDAMNVNTGDSGNRVLFQIVPLVIMMFISWFVELLGDDEVSADKVSDGK